MIAVEKKKQGEHGFKHAQSSLPWALHPFQCKGHVCGKQQGIIFSFLLSYVKKTKTEKTTKPNPNTELAQFVCWFTSNEIPISSSNLCSHLSKCWNLHYRKSPVQVFSNSEMLHSLHRFLGLVLESELSLREEGRQEAICLSRFLWNCH